jgi:hypothetical protein
VVNPVAADIAAKLEWDMNIVARGVAVALVAVCACPVAAAQDWSLEFEGDYVQLHVPAGVAMPTVDEVAARLSEGLGLPRMTPGLVRPDEVLFTAPGRYGRTWRLQNDVFRRGSDEVLLPRGAALYETVYNYQVIASGRTEDAMMHDLSWRIWCGLPPPGDSRGAVELCIRTRRGQAEATRSRNYWSWSQQSFFPVTWPELIEDASAAAELPVREWTYTLERLSARQIVMQRTLRVAERNEEVEPLRINRAPDGTFVIPYGRASIVLTPADGGVRPEVRIEPDLREFAASLVASAQQGQARD